jgi:tetratricopeptide (TPR) repeat protein
VERYLNHQPILARPASAVYQLRKLVLRHRAAAASLAAIFALTLAFGVAMAFQARRIARERDRALTAEAKAKTEAETAKRVTEFMVDLFKVSDPSEARGNTITAREVLDKGAERIVKELEGQPAVQATLQDAIGTVYMRLGLWDDAMRLLEESLHGRTRTFGSESLEVAASEYSLGCLMLLKRDYSSDREPGLRKSLAVRRSLLGVESLDVAASLYVLGAYLGLRQADLRRGPTDEPEHLLRESLAIRRRLVGNDDPLVAEVLAALGFGLSWSKGDLDAGEPLLAEALAIRRRRFGDQHAETIESLHFLASHFFMKGDYPAAEALYREALANKRRILAADHPMLCGTMLDLALLLARQDGLDEGASLLREAVAIARARLPDRNPLRVKCETHLADLEWALGNYVEAETLYRAAVRADRNPTSLFQLGSLLAAAGRPEAESVLRAAAAEVKDPPSYVLPFIEYRLAELLRSKGREEEARRHFERSWKAEQVRTDRSPTTSAQHWERVAESEANLGRTLMRLGRFDEAEPLLIRSYPGLQKKYGGRHYMPRELLSMIAEMYEGWRKPEKAAVYRALIPPPHSLNRRPKRTSGS